jgi:hypothetical protein
MTMFDNLSLVDLEDAKKSQGSSTTFEVSKRRSCGKDADLLGQSSGSFAGES